MAAMRRQDERCGLPRGFTLVEAIVVVVILGVVAAAIAPRLVRGNDRATMTELASVRGMLESAALRRTLSAQSVGVLLENHTLSLVTRQPDDRGRLAWRVDHLVDSVRLERLSIDRARLNGVVMPSGAWLAELPTGEPTRVEILLKDAGSSRAWWLDLHSGAGTVRLRKEGDAAEEGRIDLDELGMRDEPW